MSKICLVLEGGGNRGIYTSGVLDAFIDNNIDIKNIYGVSAGALNAISYLSKQRGRSYRVNKDYAMSKECVDYKRIFKFKSILNLNYLLEDITRDIDPLNFEEFDKRENYVVVCTNIVNGNAIYKKIDDYYKDLPYIRASASLPILTDVVEIDSFKLLDGGLSDPIPVIKALEDGYDKVIVVLTRDKQFISRSYKHINVYKTKYFKYPKLIKAMENRYNKYNVTRDLIVSLQEQGKVLAIYPSSPIKISHLEKDYDKLDDIYQLGYQDCSKIIDKVKDFLK